MITEYLSILTDPAHVLAEATFIFIETVLIGLILRPLIQRAVRQHDRDWH